MKITHRFKEIGNFPFCRRRRIRPMNDVAPIIDAVLRRIVPGAASVDLVDPIKVRTV